MTEYDSYIIQKLKNIQSSEDYLKQNPEETREAKLASMYGSVVMKQVQEALYGKEEEMTDEEYDNIYYDQQDDTSNEVSDETYNAYYEGGERQKSTEYRPEGFEKWSRIAQHKWLEKNSK